MKQNESDKNQLNRRLDENHLFLRMVKYCAYQERSEQDVLEKLGKYKLSDNGRMQIINRLKEEKYLDNRRFARMYASGKLRNNKWGRIRIRYELKRKSIPPEYIEEAIRSIDENEYAGILMDLIRNKKKLISHDNRFLLRNKIAHYLSGKGFENDLVWEQIRKEIP